MQALLLYLLRVFPTRAVALFEEVARMTEKGEAPQFALTPREEAAYMYYLLVEMGHEG